MSFVRGTTITGCPVLDHYDLRDYLYSRCVHRPQFCGHDGRLPASAGEPLMFNWVHNINSAKTVILIDLNTSVLNGSSMEKVGWKVIPDGYKFESADRVPPFPPIPDPNDDPMDIG